MGADILHIMWYRYGIPFGEVRTGSINSRSLQYRALKGSATVVVSLGNTVVCWATETCCGYLLSTSSQLVNGKSVTTKAEKSHCVLDKRSAAYAGSVVEQRQGRVLRRVKLFLPAFSLNWNWKFSIQNLELAAFIPKMIFKTRMRVVISTNTTSFVRSGWSYFLDTSARMPLPDPQHGSPPGAQGIQPTVVYQMPHFINASFKRPPIKYSDSNKNPVLWWVH